ncbi:helix-turn-helix transcriptional regulator [Leptobacterium sp. I13]|uniref:helix-turn-helix domain-containing protein n=1 Tax=Leptobacterium meishanense TaxID=3128904 RepID=UPI0030EC8404
MDYVLRNIRNVRKVRGYSQEYLAFRLNISQAAYTKLERNETKLSVERLLKIAEVLETPLEQLLEIASNKSHDKKESTKMSPKMLHLYEARLKDKDKMIEKLEALLHQRFS